MCVVSESQQRVSGIILSLILAAGCSYQDCVLPVHPTHGKHVPFELDCPAGTQTAACQGEPGTTVPDGWFLFVVCDQGFVLDNGEQGNSQTTCADGRWLPSLPSCVYNFTGDHHRCAAPPYPQNGKYKPLPIECAMNNKDAEDYLLPGTFVPSSCVLLYSCNKGYELSDEDVISICVKGEWIPNTVTCNKGSTLVATRTNNVRDPSGKGCVLPKQPQNRRYCSFQCKDCTNQYNRCAYSPGSLVTDFVIKVQCNYGYGLANHQDYADIVCVNGTWNTEFPRCLKLCPPLESDSVYPRCMYGNTRVDCSKPMLPDTTAVYQCRPSYSEYPSLTAAGVYKRTLTCRQNGRWSNTLPECEPVCGVSKGGVTISPTVVDGIDTPLGAFPWHAGLYTKDGDNWQCICGGTLISNRIVLTAAHCVVLEEPKDLKVGLGKYYRSWDYEEPFAVKCNVSDIRIPIEYNGAATTYVWDIALILLTEKVQVNSFVMPVCRDIHMTLEITEDTTGYVVGWGKTKADGKESDVLLHNDLTIIDHTVCSRKIPKILSIDKFCGAKGSVSIAEKGDSGGGLTTISNDLHYIIGIVSVKIDNLSLFTNVSWPTHYSWLENEINSFDKEIYRGEK